MQGNPCYARLFADLTRTPQGAFSCPFGTIHLVSPNPIKASGGQSRAPPVAGGARRKPSEQGSARKAPRADAARPLRTALRPPNPRGFFDRLPFIGDAVTGRAPGGRRRLAGPEGPPAPQGQPNKSQGPGAFGPRPWLSGRFAPSRRPPGAPALLPPPKMAGRQGRPAGRDAARARTVGQSRCPRPTGSGGGRGWPRAAALGRPLPLGRDCRRARSTAVRAAPPCAQHRRARSTVRSSCTRPRPARSPCAGCPRTWRPLPDALCGRRGSGAWGHSPRRRSRCRRGSRRFCRFGPWR